MARTRGDLPEVGVSEVVVASEARNADGDSGIFDNMGAFKTIRAQLDVTARSGTTPTLDVAVEDTLDGVNFYPIGTFAQKVNTGREVINVTAPFSDRVRVRWGVGGVTPSFTFSVAWYLEQ